MPDFELGIRHRGSLAMWTGRGDLALHGGGDPPIAGVADRFAARTQRAEQPTATSGGRLNPSCQGSVSGRHLGAPGCTGQHALPHRGGPGASAGPGTVGPDHRRGQRCRAVVDRRTRRLRQPAGQSRPPGRTGPASRIVDTGGRAGRRQCAGTPDYPGSQTVRAFRDAIPGRNRQRNFHSRHRLALVASGG